MLMFFKSIIDNYSDFILMECKTPLTLVHHLLISCTPLDSINIAINIKLIIIIININVQIFIL